MCRRTLLGMAMLLCFGTVQTSAQNVQGVEPIVLTTSPADSRSPAATASQLVALPHGHYTARVSSDRDFADDAFSASTMRPLPGPGECRNYTLCSTPASPTTVTMFRPTTVTAAPQPHLSTPTVEPLPEGYVVGRGLIGQPKLYKPGQPLRNFLRFLTF
ncbi:MAG: hypothetical protein ACODAD_02830 [Planctomycetota bacterium]